MHVTVIHILGQNFYNSGLHGSVEFRIDCVLSFTVRQISRNTVDSLWTTILLYYYIAQTLLVIFSLQCFDTVGWATGRVSGL